MLCDCQGILEGLLYLPLLVDVSCSSLSYFPCTKHMHLQSDLTRDDCKSLPRPNFTRPLSLPYITGECEPMSTHRCPPSWLFVLQRALCIKELLQHMANAPHFICYSSHQSPATCPSCSQGRVLALLLSSGPPNLSLCKQLHGCLLRCKGSAKKLARNEATRKQCAEISWKRGQYRGNWGGRSSSGL